ncbi:WDdomain 60 [Trypanosoma rangeli]|uniref:WDdomain 60 n=1 Tax=Trypanosoma rangeli TaxID=5698 RepID=A0A3R7KCG9_TRYRA|nr:WDdomain 60 [Trypanosoma rangeli]RNF05332.1 WDdomain 60 [Trypanosoma rangeli]|eukprot:RNF05332.1 WDdomain 60 [Trypanosoma rangeli]
MGEDAPTEKSKRDETKEERRARKERERAERKLQEQNEAERSAQAAEGNVKERRHRREETEEERRIRKERERAERKEREREREKLAGAAEEDNGERRHRREETEEERRIRKERERAERKEREREREQLARAAEEDNGERRHRREETEEERRIRKERERAERKEREKIKQEYQQEHDSNGGVSRKVLVNDETVVDDELQTWQQENQETKRGGVVIGGTKEELTTVMEAENRAIRQAADEARKAARRDERRHAEEEQEEEEAMERREKRRKEREEKKLLQSQMTKTSGAVAGKSALGVSDLQRQGYRTQFEKDLQRATALRRLVGMDDVSVSLIDVSPQSQYDMYIRNFVDTSRKQAGVQAPAEEDCIDFEVQAERVGVRHRGVEVPCDLGLCPEQFADRPMHFVNKDVGQGEVGNTMENNDAVVEAPLGNVSGAHMVDSTLLAAFLGRVFPVMQAVLDENDEEKLVPGDFKSKSETQFSTSYTTFSFAATCNRPVLKVFFNLCAPAYVAVLHGLREEEGPSRELDRYMSVIVIWNIYDSSSPEKVLVSPLLLTCMCMSPRWPYLVYAGAEDGSLYVWDTREPERNHITAGCIQRNAFRLPSFATSWQTGNHNAPIVAVAVAGYNTVVGVRKDESEQLVSLDATGGTYFWVVNEKDQSKGAISDTENGLHMFSTVRLFLATSKSKDHVNALSLNQESFALDFVPTDSSHYVVACAAGVRHISRFGGIAAPSLYGPCSRFFARPVAVPSCVRYGTVDSRIFVVGYDDGSVRLYLHTDAEPQLSMPLCNQRIVDMRFNGGDKWLLWALDASGTLFLLDLAKKDKEFPVLSQSLLAPDTGCCTCFDIPPEGKGDSRVIVLGFEKGMIQLHTLTDLTHTPSTDREEHWL